MVIPLQTFDADTGNAVVLVTNFLFAEKLRWWSF